MQQRPSGTSNERGHAQEAAEAALAAAERAAEAAGRAARAAKEWAAPRAEQAGRAAARKASPYVKRAGSKAEQWADVAHGAIVGAAIPAVIAAFERAAQEQEEEPAMAQRNNTWAKVLVPVLIAGAAGAALVIWARRDPRRQAGWAPDEDDWDFSGEDSPAQRFRDDVNRVVDATQDAAKKAAVVVAGAAEGVASQAAPLVEKAAATAKEEAARLKSGLSAARNRAAVGLAETLDDAEDVWDDEVAEPEKPQRKTRAPKA